MILDNRSLEDLDHRENLFDKIVTLKLGYVDLLYRLFLKLKDKKSQIKR